MKPRTAAAAASSFGRLRSTLQNLSYQSVTLRSHTMLSRTLRSVARRQSLAASTSGAARTAAARTFVQATNIDRAEVIDPPHIPGNHFAPIPGASFVQNG